MKAVRRALERGGYTTSLSQSLPYGRPCCALRVARDTNNDWCMQMQALASGVGTMLGTVVRIPCEVLKQRLQVCAR